MTRRPFRAARLRSSALAAAAAVVVATGCTSSAGRAAAPPGSGPAKADSPSGASSSSAGDFRAQRPAWRTCADDGTAQSSDPAYRSAVRRLECAKLRVPLDYAAPDGKSIQIAVYRLPAAGPAGERLGSLATNPGGPGSGVRSTVVGLAAAKPEVAKRYDIVGFDPRGTGASRPVVCGDGPLMDRIQSLDPTTADAAQVDANAAVLKEFGQGCAARMGDLLPHLGTAEAVEDMDVLRSVLGDDKINFVGTSYGTYLGARYAAAHPDRVGRFVLDGLLDPASDRFAVAREQAVGFDTAFLAFAADCVQRRGCPFSGGADAAAASMRTMLGQLGDRPRPVGKRALDEGMASTVVSAYLYSPASWSALRDLLGALYGGDARPMLRAFDSYAGRAEDGTYQGATLAGYYEINCADGRSLTAAEADRLAHDVAADAPVLGPSVVWSWAADCAAPGPDRVYPLDAVKLPNLLLVSTTRDPATPNVAAARLKRQLPNAALVTYNGDGHVAFYRHNPCVDRATSSYLLTGAATDTTCG